MTKSVTRVSRKPAAPVVTKVAPTSPELKAAAKRKATLETKAAAAIKARDAIAVKPTRKGKQAPVAAKPTRKGKVIARNRPAGHSDESVAAYFAAHAMNPKTQRAKLRRAGLSAPYSLADVKRVCGA